MFTLDPTSSCEVCAEQFGEGHVPAVIPCGHVFCAQCLATISEKTARHLTPACPLCRGTFSNKTWRLIRVDLPGTSGGATWSNAIDHTQEDHAAARVHVLRADAKRLEDKVAQAASKKCSFEEVSSLHKEVQDWLSADPYTSKNDPQHAGLRLSADLLRAILLNCIAYSESSKAAKAKEAQLSAEIDKLNAEVRRQRDLVATKSIEADKLRDELNRIRPNNATRLVPPPRPSTVAPPSSHNSPARPGTSMGIHSSSTRAFSSASEAASRSPSSSRPGTASGTYTSSSSAPSTPYRSSSSAARNDSPPQMPAILAPAAPLPPTTPPSYSQPMHHPSIPRSSTPAPISSHRRAASMAVPQRPSTSMSNRHERWIPGADVSPPPVPALPRNLYRGAPPMPTRGFQRVLQEAE